MRKTFLNKFSFYQGNRSYCCPSPPEILLEEMRGLINMIMFEFCFLIIWKFIIIIVFMEPTLLSHPGKNTFKLQLKK
jgi:hypothetical protein